MKTLLLISAALFSITLSCQQQKPNENPKGPKGDLFIIGGGSRPESLVHKMISIAGLRDSGYAVVLPMSSAVPDTSAYYGKKQFYEAGISRVVHFHYEKGDRMPEQQLDSIRNAALIYLTGGNQNRFMEVAAGTLLPEAIRTAYKKGATIAGTSAGASLQSSLMMTGDEKKYPEYDGDFPTIEANNIILEPGLKLLKNAILDQHFIQRSRMNRLITAIIEHPEKTGIGIDESTAIHVYGDSARVYGKAQVVVFKNYSDTLRARNGYLGVRDMDLSIYLPGEKFRISKE